MDKKIKYSTLIIEGTKYKTTLTKKFENRKNWELPDIRKMVAFIPGKILKLSASTGQKVKKGQLLFILEAMKMRNRVTAPISGEIKDVYVKNGDNVAKNQIILEFK